MKAGQGNACKRQAGALRSDGDHNCTFNFIHTKLQDEKVWALEIAIFKYISVQLFTKIKMGMLTQDRFKKVKSLHLKQENSALSYYNKHTFEDTLILE